MVSGRFLTPMPALLLQSLIAVVMAFMGDIMNLIDFFSFAIWLFYALTFLANIVMRFQKAFKVTTTTITTTTTTLKQQQQRHEQQQEQPQRHEH